MGFPAWTLKPDERWRILPEFEVFISLKISPVSKSKIGGSPQFWGIHESSGTSFSRSGNSESVSNRIFSKSVSFSNSWQTRNHLKWIELETISSSWSLNSSTTGAHFSKAARLPEKHSWESSVPDQLCLLKFFSNSKMTFSRFRLSKTSSGALARVWIKNLRANGSKFLSFPE